MGAIDGLVDLNPKALAKVPSELWITHRTPRLDGKRPPEPQHATMNGRLMDHGLIEKLKLGSNV